MLSISKISVNSYPAEGTREVWIVIYSTLLWHVIDIRDDDDDADNDDDDDDEEEEE